MARERHSVNPEERLRDSADKHIAHAHPDVVHQWLSKLSDPDERESYRQQLDVIAQGGVEVSRMGPREWTEFETLRSSIADFMAGRLTPAGERALRIEVARIGAMFQSLPMDDVGAFDVGSIVAPVHSPEGDASLVVRLSQLPHPESRADVKVWMTALKAAIALIERELASVDGSNRLAEYRKWIARS